MDTQYTPATLSERFAQLYLKVSLKEQEEAWKPCVSELWNFMIESLEAALQPSLPDLIEILKSVPRQEQDKYVKDAIYGGYYMFESSDPSMNEWLRNFANPVEVGGIKHLLVGQIHLNVHPGTLKNYAERIYKDFSLRVSDNQSKISKCIAVSFDLKERLAPNVCFIVFD